MTQPKHAVVFLLDRSGSMKSILNTTLESFNGYLAKLKETPDVEFTLTQFDTISTDTLCRRTPVKDVKDLDKDSFVPRAGTPLVDAACLAIDWAKMDYDKADKVVITILTDGQENSSREFKMEDLHDRIKEVSGWGWQLVFLGASVDNYADARKMGIGIGQTMSYNSRNPEQATGALCASAASTQAYFATGEKVEFSEELKAKSGDVWVKDYAQKTS